LYRNDRTNTNSWIGFQLEGTNSNRDAIGARVEIYSNVGVTRPDQIREIDGGSNFLGQNERVVHFGLGTNTQAVSQVIIRWPSGAIQHLENLAIDTVHPIVEASNCTAQNCPRYNMDIPRLDIVEQPQAWRLRWPARFGGFALEATGTLDNEPDWQPVPAPSILGPDTWQVETDREADLQIFRLYKP
ncbi:MAG: hypothetical protein ACI97B_004765, partial [Verrucomicrobiales bacterium]